MKFTMTYRMTVPICLCELEIDEERLVEDFGSVENFLLWCKNQPETQKERNLLKKLSEQFPMEVDDYVKSVGSHNRTFKGHRFDDFKGIDEGGLEDYEHLIESENNLRFKKKDGSVVSEVRVGFE